MSYEVQYGVIEQEVGEAVLALIATREPISRSGIINYLHKKREETGNAAYKEMLRHAADQMRQAR
ncbi:hypothetical protein N5923_05605 [Erwiniaceae bacterium BAC15a-03b]|uniref:Uncharacterized protein n=1 Tax=Winslowiella arboricola TaxID=2978220 RepID=A0A9J6PMT3_9GAMM|nr:hypothetical protein [Winslowiella arboricola]MCU5774099.1 hypothetical protein [Winslowiella arboricola]MCU5776968.1 hypothetical protein [Winslowiella arboricola]